MFCIPICNQHNDYLSGKYTFYQCFNYWFTFTWGLKVEVWLRGLKRKERFYAQYHNTPFSKWDLFHTSTFCSILALRLSLWFASHFCNVSMWLLCLCCLKQFWNTSSSNNGHFSFLVEMILNLPKHVFLVLFFFFFFKLCVSCNELHWMNVWWLESEHQSPHNHIFTCSYGIHLCLVGNRIGVLPHIKLLFQLMKYVCVSLPFQMMLGVS